MQGADAGFCFGRGTGMGARRILRHEAEKTTYTERKRHILTLYENIIIIIISSTHRFIFPAIFVLKYKTQSAGFRASETVHNKPMAAGSGM